ncbi:alpha-N-methyltransferase NTM1 [Collybia nuda]|uniref:Alpha N-terminal protein methyltransferase 1 n=1 Tax=Collybia nuda TaxID=64659 RepID=A0A9P5YBQ3_9AGAR|nr:alpha-N-methyltransferase NTM1 [Collybia nuda]
MDDSTPLPNVRDGIEYWNTQPASLDGVLGGFGSGSLPRLDSLGSRQFLLNIYPDLSTVSSSLRPLAPQIPQRTRALDVGAGIGRVTGDVLLHLVSDVVLLEPVDSFVQEALAKAIASINPSTQFPWKGIADRTHSVTILQGTLQDFDPMKPHRAKFLDRVGYQLPQPSYEIDMGFDIIWCQWCLGHLSDLDLVAFLRRSHTALRDGKSLIMVKENLCQDLDDGIACTLFDEQDSSLTRSDKAWKTLFDQAGLRLVREQVQHGLPEGLYVVKMYALR